MCRHTLTHLDFVSNSLRIPALNIQYYVSFNHLLFLLLHHLTSVFPGAERGQRSTPLNQTGWRVWATEWEERTSGSSESNSSASDVDGAAGELEDAGAAG